MTISQDSQTLSIYSNDTSDSILMPVEYIFNVNVDILCDQIIEISPFVYLKEDEVSVPQGILKLEIISD